mmetsp:Transcript_19897/g.24561  ORF Transcript_19897/g.24561 Transcript_19897/m.24561 type:complete len:276 (+) Transcript_19897:139-966(+)|eukprot:CAMPEP_0172500894 /NCGR_PEP_ID=MMETSP1066-20121228/143969_1 /TAXON_ID=671091 /ORGANISM="Coscinodiscus wailesii, Strain CCMP2513" /LENGTH=275 /DNA_ID=CAMNT_0013275377 /DNA_START=121 /DNA_END=948 /DNA_ORIENTATION=-
MGWFNDLFKGGKYKEDTKKLSLLVKTLTKDMDKWIKGFENDGTPPNEEQGKELEDAKIAEFEEEYDSQAIFAVEGKDENNLIPEYKEKLQENLEEMRGDLYRRFSGAVDSLERSAAKVLKACVKAYTRKEAELKTRLPMGESDIVNEFDELIEDLTEFISTRFPDGVEGLDNYDDELPDGIPSWSEFKEQCSAKVEEIKGLSEEAIPAAVEEIKANTLASVKKSIDEAINKTMDAVKEDLSDDSFPYLNEDATAELRSELISMSEEYGKSRLSES